MGNPTIVVIDDDPNARKTLTDILKVKGYEPFAAKDGSEGIAVLRQHRPRVVLIDLGLPDMSGLDVLKTVRTEFPDTVAIIVTGNASLDSAIEATNKGAFSYIQKPYDMGRLLLLVRHAAEKWELADKLRQYQEHLEELVQERTEELQREVAEHKQAEEKIAKLNEDLKRYIAELEAARMLADAGIRARGEFLANISHELITPLNSIIGFSQILIDGLVGPMNEQQKDYAASILQGGNRLHETLKEIVQFAGLESGEMQLHTDRFLLKDLLKSALLSFNEKAAVQDVALSLEIGLPLENEIEADRGKLHQALFMLLDNAIKFTPTGGSVRVQARLIAECRMRNADSSSPQPSPSRGEEGSQSEIRNLKSAIDRNFVEISVSDTGIGIKEEDMPRLFRPFQQLESPYTKKYRGTGLGLMLAKKIVDLHGGRIWVKSEIGKGSTFTFAIPVGQGKSPG